ncbi:MAG: glycosyltransferase [Polaromonas sp.]
MTDASTINDGTYWDHRFATDWESFEGPRQSRFFAKLAIDHLPQWLLEQMRQKSFTVADWGCALGDGTDVWAGYVDSRQITGIDFSPLAIGQARQRYPAIRFVSSDWLDASQADAEMFDVVFSSNTLEHFHRPYDVLETMGKRARKAIVLALPYRERDRISEHFFSFLPENIPLVLPNGFRLVWSRVVDCTALPDAMWDGDQVFLVYAASEWVDGLNLALKDQHIESQDSASQVGILTRLSDAFKSQTADAVELLASRDGQIASQSESLLAQAQQISVLQDTLSGRDEKIAELALVLKESERLSAETIQSMTQSMAQRDAHITGLDQLIAAQAEQAETLNQMLRERDTLITELAGQILASDEKVVSLQQLTDRCTTQIADYQQFISERDHEIARLSQITLDYEAQRIQPEPPLASEVLLSSVQMLRKTRSWKITIPLRFAVRVYRYGLLDEDRRNIAKGLRAAYQRVPLPVSARKMLGMAYRNTVKPSYAAVRNQVLATVPFQPPVDVPAAQDKGKPDYIVWGVIDWHFRHQRPQQLAQALAASGRRVFYISANLVDDARAGFSHESLDSHNRLYQINLHAAGAPVIYTSAPSHDALIQLRASMGDVLAWAGSRQLVSLVQHPFWCDIASVLPNSRLIYDCMDHHEGFGNTASAVLALERALMRHADLTITTSVWLDNIVAEHTPNRALIRNAGEFDHFSRKREILYTDAQGRKIIGYYGAIAEWFDQDLVELIAQRFPDCCILLIGDDTVNAKKRFKPLSNIVMLGEIPYVELPTYLHAFDVCLLPFKVIPLTLATNPVKVYEYLSAGKSVVSVDLPEMQQFGDLVRVAENSEGFLTAVQDVLSGRDAPDAGERRQAFAREQTWKHRASTLISHAESSIRDPRVSVIVVTYNNLDFTRACLASLDEQTDYDNMEIIVVDNASSDNSAEFLAQWVTGASNRKLVLNDDNRGFAAANNQGLVLASGSYLVLLNNDTYVTPGWVRTLFGHLQRDASIGLIGPVTNNIGNEARIQIAYETMDQMIHVSQAHVRRHLGQTFPLHTAAFFCVMFSRSVYEQVGPLDEAFGRGFFEDDDYCRRIDQIGLRVACAEDVFIHHHLSASFNKLRSADRQALFDQNKLIYEKKWGAWAPHAYRP